MSILNRPSDGLFNLLLVIVRCLATQGPMPREKLLGLCAPSSLVDKPDMATNTLNRWVQLGLLEQDASETVRIGGAVAAELKQRHGDHVYLARIVRELVLSPQNNERFWEADDNASADFVRGIAWVLAQNVFEFRYVAHKDVQAVEVRQLPDCAGFTNDTRWAGFKAWAPFLGFGWTSSIPHGLFIIDPTVAVRDALSRVFGGSRELPQATFFNRLADVLPVVDGGRYRRFVEERIDHSVWTAPEPGEVSTSLSRALHRLHLSQEITLVDRADAEKRNLLGRNRAVIRSVSHVVWSGSNG